MNGKPTILNIALTGGATYDDIPLPSRILRICISSQGNISILKIKFGGDTYLQIEAGAVYDSDWINPQWMRYNSPEISINGTGVAQIEYWS